ncbi:MAG TPA: hypothetical protein VL625_11250 [Patescibacteria group bacterium]|nr:hypothetical protein [Patescibacteria group bacterium]
MSALKQTMYVFATLFSLFLLASCGEGYEKQPYHGVPYDGDRTAGSGVEYVIAHMAPAKEVDTTPQEKAPEPAKAEEKPAEAVAPAPEPTPAPPIEEKKGDAVFHKAVVK